MNKLVAQWVPRFYGQFYNLFCLIAPKATANTAFHLFCTVRKGKVLTQQQEYLDAAKYELLHIGDHTIQTYIWPGKGKTVLLMHGWESNTYRWRNLIAKLRQQEFTIVAFDAPGHGASSGKYLYVPLYAEILQHLIIKYNPHQLVGHSVAGMTILYNEHKNDNPNIEKIVTVASPSEFHEIMEHFQGILKFNNRVMRALDNYIYERFGVYIRDFSTSKYASTNTKKGLLFHDKLDQITPYHASVNVQAQWKDSTLISTEGFGHSLHQDEVNDQLVDFLKS
ncbi:MAG: alpha/beta hydrolase [Flavobacteriaceae bacterium]